MMVTIDPMCSIENDVIVSISSINGTAGIGIVDDLSVTMTDPPYLPAVGGSDFVPVAQMLMFTDATREIPVSVEILNDTVVEDQEVFTLTLATNVDPMDVVLPDSPVEVSINDTSSGIYNC